jgi:LmbE family N-acetylglucosaminyl deacetylase
MEEYINEIKKILQLPKIEECENVLCVQPHPDDGDISSGATIAKLTSLGKKVTYLFVTDGSAGINGKSRMETAKIRKNEEIKAAKMLGVKDLIWLDHPDAGEYSVSDLKSEIIKVIRKLKPDLIMTVDPFLPYEFHPDHISTGIATAQAALFYNNSIVKAVDKDYEPYALRAMAFFFTAFPNQFVCVDDFWEKKFQAIFEHKSQVSPETFKLYREYFDIKGKFYGEKIGCKYAEGFKVLIPEMFHAFAENLWI